VQDPRTERMVISMCANKEEAITTIEGFGSRGWDCSIKFDDGVWFVKFGCCDEHYDSDFALAVRDASADVRLAEARGQKYPGAGR